MKNLRMVDPCPRPRTARLGIAVGLAAVLITVFMSGIREVAATATATSAPRLSAEAPQLPGASATNILVATDAAFWPMDYMSGTQVVGHDIDLMNAIGAEISVTVVYTIVPWAGIFDGLIAGQYDSIVDGLTVTPQREEVIDFTLPYVTFRADENVAIAVQQGDDVLRHQMNEALVQLRADGTLETIVAAIAADVPEWEPHLPNWTFCSVPTDTESTLVYTDTQGLPTAIQVPPGTVSETTTLVYAPVDTATEPPGFAFAGHAFGLEAYQGGTFRSSFVFSKPITITIHYGDADILGLDEGSLELDYWDGDQWMDAATTCTPTSIYDPHIDENWLAVPICHLSNFALFGETTRVYLPIIMQLYVIP